MRSEISHPATFRNKYESERPRRPWGGTELPAGIYVDRIAGGHRHHCHPGGAVVAGVVAGKGERAPHRLPEQSKATGYGLANVRRRTQGQMASNDWDLRFGNVPESPTNSWVMGDAGLDADPATITGGTIYPYVRSIQVYRCPANRSLVLGTSIPIWRTYSLSCYMGGPPADTTEFGLQPLHQTGQIRNPTKALTFVEEDDATIDDGHFLYSATVNNWYNLPSWAHRNGTTLVFADGHGEYWRWQSARPTTTYFTSGSALTDPLALADVARMQKTAPASN
jgi:hypothetical protein